jgi:hypothetical protein
LLKQAGEVAVVAKVAVADVAANPSQQSAGLSGSKRKGWPSMAIFFIFSSFWV